MQRDLAITVVVSSVIFVALVTALFGIGVAPEYEYPLDHCSAAVAMNDGTIEAAIFVQESCHADR